MKYTKPNPKIRSVQMDQLAKARPKYLVPNQFYSMPGTRHWWSGQTLARPAWVQATWTKLDMFFFFLRFNNWKKIMPIKFFLKYSKFIKLIPIDIKKNYIIFHKIGLCNIIVKFFHIIARNLSIISYYYNIFHIL